MGIKTLFHSFTIIHSVVENMKKYLETSRYIDWDHPSVQKMAKDLSAGNTTDDEIANSCFIFVRDEIKHSSDYKLNPITIKASDVLNFGTGYCYAKSHLLAALLRANSIPAGLCYQRLTIENDRPPFCLHGLNAIYLKKYGWYRVDARGNKDGVNAQFSPPYEQLAYSIVNKGECNFQGIWPEPLSVVVDVLETYTSYNEVSENLPDIEILVT